MARRKLTDQEKLKKLLDHAWLNLGDVCDLEIANPLSHWSKEDLDNPVKRLLRMMRDPRYFAYTCKVIFNVTLLPIQVATLWELYTHPFPMLICNRGFGKSFLLALYAMLKALLNQGIKVVVVGAAFRQAKVVFEYCETIWHNAPILRDLVGTTGRSGPRRDIDRCTMTLGDSVIVALPLGDGTKIRGQRANVIIADEFACLDHGTLVETDAGLIRIGDAEPQFATTGLTQPDESTVYPDAFIRTPPCDAYKVTTVGGYEFICSAIHQVKTVDGWKYGKDLTASDYLLHKSSNYFPVHTIQDTDIVVDEEVAWLLGALVSEGCVSSKHQLSVHTTDKAFALRVQGVLKKLSANQVGLFYQPEYEDDRGWYCKESWTVYCCDLALRDTLNRLGLERITAPSKRIPWSILQSPRLQVVQFLRGLFDGDGSAFHWSSRGRSNHLGVAFYSSSESLAREVQIILHKLGCFSTRQSRKSKLSTRPQWMLRLNGEDAHKLAQTLDVPRWHKIVTTACTPYEPGLTGVVWDKSRSKWKAEIRIRGRQKYLGRFATKEQAIEAVQRNAIEPHLKVRLVQKLDGQRVLYDYHVPVTNQFLANCFVQHNSIPRDVFETVVSGFGVVSMNPVDNVQHHARVSLLKKLGRWKADMKEERAEGNQTIIAGTAYYDFNHFADYWKKWKAIINSRGDRKKLGEILGGEENVDGSLNWKDFCVIRIPVELLPHGFMDAKHVARSKATVHAGIYQMEFGACYANDSAGFFSRRLIEKCVVGRINDPIELPGLGDVHFTATIRGNPQLDYIFGVDPASEKDRFSIVILEVHGTHRRIAYCWTTTRADYKDRLKLGLTEEHDFYGHCARKIRDLMRAFPCKHIAMDSQGGGIAVLEALHDPKNLKQDELPVWPRIDKDNPQDTDGQPGLHILEMVNFSKAEYTGAANHGMRKDFEDRVLLFPHFDGLSVQLATEDDRRAGRIQSVDGHEVSVYDTLEDVVLEIEYLKDELATIVHTQTASAGRDHWDTPEVKLPGNKKGRLRKDRYSALLMANMAARTYQRALPAPTYNWVGGVAQAIGRDQGQPGKGPVGSLYNLGPEWFSQGANGAPQFGHVVRRKV